MKTKVAVAFGGQSSEYGVSLQSAYEVIKHLDTGLYEVFYIGISKEGSWYRFKGDVTKIREDSWCNAKDTCPVSVSLDASSSLLFFEKGGVVKERIDVFLPILHGRNGEDGTVQGMLELAGIKVAGCGILSSALCMDKERAKDLVHLHGIRVPKAIVLNKHIYDSELEKRVEEIGYPVFVKPVKAGSSYGVSKVEGTADLQSAIELAFQYDKTIMIEEGIVGKELACAILGNEELIAGEIDEVDVSEGFFDFKSKYLSDEPILFLPARVEKAERERVQEVAKKIYKILDCKGLARVDIFFTEDREIIFNEVNTLPGFTSHSRYPSMMKEIGIDFGDIIKRLIELALEG